MRKVGETGPDGAISQALHPCRRECGALAKPVGRERQRELGEETDQDVPSLASESR